MRWRAQMPKNAWSAKRERQYAHIKESLIEHGKPVPLAEEIAARVVTCCNCAMKPTNVA